MFYSEQRDLPNEVSIIDTGLEKRDEGLGLNETDILLHPLSEPAEIVFAPAGLPWQRSDVDNSITNFDIVGGRIIGPKIESTAAAQVESGVMPMAGENAVLNAAAMERKSQVWTTIIYCRYSTVVRVHSNRPVRPAYDYDFSALKFREGGNTD
jgi:hypothetical protein